MREKHVRIEVVLPLALPGTLTYSVPPELVPRLRLGARVVVPLATRRATGYVAAIDVPPPHGEVALRDILAVPEDVAGLPEDLLRLILEAARYYCAPPGEALRAALPRFAEKTARRVPVVRAVPARNPEGRLGPGQKRLLAALAEVGELALDEARRAHGISTASIRALAAKGRVELGERDPVDPFAPSAADPAEPVPEPNPHQQRAITAVLAAVRSGRYHGFLLHGVTASGKTEVYLRCAAETIALGRSCLVLVPEIALTPQLVGRFRARLGGAVALVHSAVGEAERRRAWSAMLAGRVRVAVGARSALFAPLSGLGLVVVDEEHDPSYKQSDRFRYHARDLAMLRAHHAGATVVLGSATPSLESWSNAHDGKLELLRLPERATPLPLPAVRVCDLRRHGARHPRHPFLSRELVEELAGTLARREQSILFLNRRGFAPTAICTSCGTFVACPSCGVALAYHRARDALLCHYCNFQRPVPAHCESCREGELDLRGLGTERIVDAVNDLFPSARVGRLDSDVAAGPSVERVLDRLRRREIDVLVGTQMVTKGHDFPAVTLVGVVRADMGLQVVDFRAAERTFQLLTQVAGRAGRGSTPGLVLLQTFLPDHYAVAAAARQDYDGFVRQELPFRRELGYPPFGRLALLRGESRDADALDAAMDSLARTLAPLAAAAHASLLGPSPAPLARLRGFHRRHLLVKAPTRKAIRTLAVRAAAWATRAARHIRLVIDIDPLHLA
ncbi:MAG: primosomal protein N' [Deltaproteobacteria bacterium]|nr:primosomal protein N' [Deltaproteobacteria bacterium]